MDNSSQPAPPWSRIEEIAAKYFSVWVWSIVTGMATGETFSLINYFPRARGSLLLVPLIPLLALSAICVLSSWIALLRFFEGFVIPVFFGEIGRIPSILTPSVFFRQRSATALEHCCSGYCSALPTSHLAAHPFSPAEAPRGRKDGLFLDSDTVDALLRCLLSLSLRVLCTERQSIRISFRSDIPYFWPSIFKMRNACMPL